MPLCPVCDKPVALDTTPTAPFCSDRCRLVDLGRWLDETQAIPVKTRLPGGGADDEDIDGESQAANVAPDEPPDD